MASTAGDGANGDKDIQPGVEAPRLRILSIDGGPSASLQIRVIAYLERMRPGFIESVDMFAGTSDGAFVSLFLASKLAEGLKGEPLAEACIQFTNQILDVFAPTLWSGLLFCTGLWPLSPVGPLEDLMTSTFGNKTLRDLEKHVVIVSFNKTKSRPAIFQNFNVTDHEMGRPLTDVALATSAFPVIVAIHKSPFDGDQYLDGAVVANSPTIVASSSASSLLAHLNRVMPGPEMIEQMRVLSLGAEQSPRQHGKLFNFLGKIINLPDPFDRQAVTWGMLQWLVSQPLFTLERIFLGSSQEIDREAHDVLGMNYFRFGPDMNELGSINTGLFSSTKKLEQSLDTLASQLVSGGKVDPLLAWLDSSGWVR